MNIFITKNNKILKIMSKHTDCKHNKREISKFQLISNFNRFMLFFVFALYLTISVGNSQPAPNYGVKGGFTNTERRLLLRQGTLYSADLNSIISNAEPVGDGTYFFKVNLIKGGIYNFIFQAKVNNNWQYEQIPNTGAFPISTNNNNVTDKKGGKITKMDDGNVRRKITVPLTGSECFAFCNFGHHPNPPLIDAEPGDGSIKLKIKAEGRWGYIEPDVVYGGYVELYRSTIDKGPYTYITNLSVNNDGYAYFTNTGLQNEATYYYVAIAYDAYQGTNASLKRGPLEKEIDVPDYDTYISQDNIDANMFSGYAEQAAITPHKAIKVIFKVDNIKWDVVEKNNYLVWLTPVNKDARFYLNKLPGRIVKVERVKQ